MNKESLLYFEILRNIKSVADKPFRNHGSLEEEMLELSGREEDKVVLPEQDFENPEEAIPVLRDLYKDDVTKISLVLSHLWPEDFLFYRVSCLEKEISQGFEYFSEIIPEFDFSFTHIRKKAIEDYLVLNDSLFDFAYRFFPNHSDKASSIYRLIYSVLPMLFMERSEYNRYWINSTSHDVLSYPDSVIWTGRKDMRPGDLVFMYETAPTKAIRSIFFVEKWPLFDPWYNWNGIKVELKKMADIPPVSFSTMRKNKVLKEWSVIKRQFQGVITESVPHASYNQLLQYISEEIKDEIEIKEEEVSEVSSSGAFSTEAEFEDSVIDPLLRSWDLKFQRQHALKCHFGTQRITGYVDFLITKNGNPVALFENKLKILNDSQLSAALNQAKSYALMLGIKCLVVGSPEGLKLYRLNGTQEELVEEFSVGNKETEESFRKMLIQESGL